MPTSHLVLGRVGFGLELNSSNPLYVLIKAPLPLLPVLPTHPFPAPSLPFFQEKGRPLWSFKTIFILKFPVIAESLGLVAHLHSDSENEGASADHSAAFLSSIFGL